MMSLSRLQHLKGRVIQTASQFAAYYVTYSVNLSSIVPGITFKRCPFGLQSTHFI
jgi:hypothetical protein